MKNILTACEPRKDILAGTFNPEIFTASISEVLRFYADQETEMHPMYTDAGQFFRETTYPTDGLKMVLSEVFARLNGDNTVPAIHRLETAFGGGKTHTLIACAHIGFKGSELAPVTADILPGELLPAAGEVAVVGIAGEDIPVHKTKGTKLVPYTLWGEIAFQIGGKSLYRELKTEAESHAAPGKNYFETVFAGKKVLLMLDELAQYAARLSVAHSGGGDQLAAFLMGLLGYARSHPGISVLLTLASSTDAFANQTEQLIKLLSDITGREISKDEALGTGEQSMKGLKSVVSRDATAVVPVQPAEISRVLAKRLLTGIDNAAAEETASAYAVLYQKDTSLLPDEAGRADYKDRMMAHYPFHPTLIDFLNTKLAASENFQGTRGVLRVLSLTVRNIWQKQVEIPMIHACHLNLRDARTVNELIGRTGSGDLLPVLNADIGGADTESIEGGRSNAELADRKNPHPEGWPMYEYTWKTVFLHSLIGRDQGLGSNLFGLTEQDAVFNVSFPGLSPSQVAKALEEIANSAFYLRYDKNQSRYYASLEPSINIALAKIRSSLGVSELDQLLDIAARKVVDPKVKAFHVVPDVAVPDHIPDNKGKPVLAIVGIHAESLNIKECVTTAGPNKPRIEQNLVIILVPETVNTAVNRPGQEGLFGAADSSASESRNRLRDLARTVLAMKRLRQVPHNYGIHPKKLEEDDFKTRFIEREKALETAVTEVYNRFWYPSANGQIVCKEIRTSGGEGGASVLEQIRKTLLDDGELVTSEHTTKTDLANLRKLFFPRRADVISIAKVCENFCRIRSWPIPDDPKVPDQLIRAGVNRGNWCLFRMGSDDNTIPDEFYSRETGELPFNIDLRQDYSLVTPEGAHKRGWSEESGPDITHVKGWVRQTTGEKQVAKVAEIVEALNQKHGDVPERTVNDAVTTLIRDGRLMTYRGDAEQQEKPDLISGTSAAFYNPDPEDVIITPAKAAEKGWMTIDKRISLSGKEGAEILFPLLRRIGSLYQRGGKTTIDDLDLTDLVLPKGGTLRITLANVPPESVRDLSELFETVASLVRKDDTTEAFLEIREPQEDCPFIQTLQKEPKK